VSVEDQELLGNIEKVVASYPGIKEVAVIAVNTGSEQQLLAAVVPADFVSGPEIRDYAWQRLGDGKSPGMVALLPAIPRDIHGAVDVQELQRALAGGNLPTSRYTAPNTPLERALTEIFREVLDVPRVGLDDHFFDLGGDSVRAVQVTGLIEARTGVRLSPEEFFDAATVRNLARRGEA